MDTKATRNNRRQPYLKLSLKKSRIKATQEPKKLNRSSDVIILDESFNKLQSDSPKSLVSGPMKIYSPILINDSCELLCINDVPKITFPDKEPPSKQGNVSFDCSSKYASPDKDSRPSYGGWSPAQNIITATPREDPAPSTPKDVANESREECSIKKIQQSQKKLLNDLYGEKWKSIPKLFKAISAKYENFDTVSKKLNFDEDGSDKENIRHDLKQTKMLYLTNSDIKRKVDISLTDTEKKIKKKLYTEKVPSTPDVGKSKLVRQLNVNSTTKKTKLNKAMSVTEMVEIMMNDVSKKVEDCGVKPLPVTPVHQSVNTCKKLSFMASLADNVPSWRCHIEATQYIYNYKSNREELCRRLYIEFNKHVFDNAMDADMPILWDSKLRTTAGTTTNRLIKNSRGGRIRTSSIKLSTKVVDGPQRLRDTLIHEMCHAATWLIDSELRAGHGPLWTKWAKRALHVYPELGEISRCHDLEIHFKYSYKCTKCGYSVQRHSKSIDVTKKCCGYCRGTFELILNKKNKDGVIISTPARKGTVNNFALYVKENYASMKDGKRSHAEIMKILGEQFAKLKVIDNNVS